MFITRKSVTSGKVRNYNLPVTIDQMNSFDEGMPAEKAFPNLSPIQREFIISGMTRTEWLHEFGDESDMGISPKEIA